MLARNELRFLSDNARWAILVEVLVGTLSKMLWKEDVHDWHAIAHALVPDRLDQGVP